MKKIFMLLAVLAAWCGRAAAEGLSVQSITIPKGGEATLEIALENPTTEFAAFQFNVELASGITVALNEKGKLDYKKGARLDEDFTLSMSQPDAEVNTFRVLGYYTETQAIPGTGGAIILITLKADAALEEGEELDCKLSAINLTEPDETKHTPADIPFTVTIGAPDDGRIKFDETKTTLPTYTAGERGNVTMKRTIKAGEWSTLVLPFNLTKKAATDIFGSDVQMAMFSGFEVDYGDDEENITPLGIQLNFTAYTIPAKGNLAGGTPILINTSQNIETIEVDNCTLVGAVTDVTVKDEYETSGKFTGTFVKTTVPEDGLFISGNEFWYSVGLTNIKAFRGWFELGAVLDKETDFGANIRYTVYDEATGIKEMVNVKGQKEAADGWYTLDGRKLSGKPIEKGVYIFNNKKVAIQ